MASYQIEWKRSAEKELSKLPVPIIPRIVQLVGQLSEDPYPVGSRKLAGSEHTYRIRVSDYRVIDTVEKSILRIEIIRVGHRREVYR